MSAPTLEKLLTGEVLPAHLTTNPSFRLEPGYQVNPGRGEFGCEVCHSRVTRNKNNHNEYGHARDCPHHQTAEVVE